MGNFYFDGCSYTAGAIPGVDNVDMLWPCTVMHELGHRIDRHNLIDYSYTAKGNDEIFTHLIKHINNGYITKDTTVVLFWTHCERLLENVHSELKMSGSKNVHPRDNGLTFKLGSTGLSDEKYSQFNHYTARIVSLFNYMIAAQKMLDQIGCKYYCLTVDSYNSFELADKAGIIDIEHLDHSRIFNWPDKFVPDTRIDPKNDTTKLLNPQPVKSLAQDPNNMMLYWVTQSWPMRFVRWHDSGNSDVSILSSDFKHYNEAGSTLLGKYIARWIKNPDENWQYIIDNESTVNQVEVYTDMNAGIEWLVNAYKEGNDRLHWVEENTIMIYDDFMKKQVEYVYES